LGPFTAMNNSWLSSDLSITTDEHFSYVSLSFSPIEN
jgi:hypothetical protein